MWMLIALAAAQEPAETETTEQAPSEEQEPEPYPEEPFPEDAPGITIVVEDTLTPDKAREELDDKITEDLGYFNAVHVGQRSYYFHPRIWKPHVMVHDAAFVNVRAHPITPIPGGQPRTISGNELNEGDSRQAQATGVGGIHTPKGMRNSQKQAVYDDLRPYVTRWGDAIWAAEQAKNAGADTPETPASETPAEPQGSEAEPIPEPKPTTIDVEPVEPEEPEQPVQGDPHPGSEQQLE
jgi:hypothetical protein